MNDHRLYRCGVEVAQMPGSSLPKGWRGAYVNVYIVAKNIRNAIDLSEQSLLSDMYKPVDTFTAWEVDLEHWQQEEDDVRSKADVESLVEPGEYLYSGFHGYGDDGYPSLRLVED